MQDSTKGKEEESQHQCSDEYCVNEAHADFEQRQHRLNVEYEVRAEIEEREAATRLGRLERKQTKRNLMDEFSQKAPMGHQVIDVDEEPEDYSSPRALDPDIDLVDDDDDDFVLQLPRECDLAWYFQQYSVDRESQVAMCRTYANHLAAKTRVARSGLPAPGHGKQKKIKYGK